MKVCSNAASSDHAAMCSESLSQREMKMNHALKANSQLDTQVASVTLLSLGIQLRVL